MDSRMAHLLQLVKAWAKARNFNDPVDGTFNTYALCLMVPSTLYLEPSHHSPSAPAAAAALPTCSQPPCRCRSLRGGF